MNTEEHDDLWELLGHAKKAEPSAFFSRNVLRALREEEQEKQGFVMWLRRHWQVTVGGLGAVAVAVIASGAFVTTGPKPQQPDPVIHLAEVVSVSPDYQVISNLDELLDSERNSIWLEASIN